MKQAKGSPTSLRQKSWAIVVDNFTHALEKDSDKPLNNEHLRKLDEVIVAVAPELSHTTGVRVLERADGTLTTAKAKLVGTLLAERAKSAGVSAVVFDRGGYKYHGRVAAVADSAREAGLTL